MQMRSGNVIKITTDFLLLNMLFIRNSFILLKRNALDFLGPAANRQMCEIAHIAIACIVSNLHKKQTWNSLEARMAKQRHVQILARGRLTN